MKYTAAFLLCIALLAGCHKDKKYSFDSRLDTLGSTWGVVNGGHITYYFQNADSWSDEVSGYVNMHEKGYETIDAVFHAQLPQKLRFFVWKDTAAARQELGRTLGFAVPTQCVVNIRPEQTIGHEMTHVLCYWSGGVTPVSLTRFVNEGVAVAFDLNTGNKMNQAKSAVAGQHFQSVLDLWNNSSQISESILYPVAGAFMQYMYEQNQPAKFDSLTKHQTVAEAQGIYGSQFDQLISDFDRQIGLQ